jgi:acetyl-CoA carboxylase carboxyl transferase subunit beta
VWLHPLVEEWDAGLTGTDPLDFPGYAAQLARAGGRESVRTGRTAHYAVVAADFGTFGGSMGAVHGERVVRAFRRAAALRLPVVVIAASGGARMQEGMVALVQMARTAAAAAAHGRAGQLSVAVLRPPTTGGVLASYASLCDVRAAQPGATIGFAGPRVVEHTLGIRLPEGAHTAESAHAAGQVDALVPPEEQAAWVEAALGMRDLPPPPPRRRPAPAAAPPATAWEAVQRARAPGRPTGTDWAAVLLDSWVELRGADPTLRAGLARFEGERLVVLACDRYAGSGRLGPDAYRLAQRAIGLADRLRLPLVSFVDTPGADPSPDAEAGGIAAAIARTLAAMAELASPSVSVCVGEGGSGGALALAAADRLIMQRDAIFSVIAPEAAAVILRRDPAQAPALAGHLGLTSAELHRLGIIDAVADATEAGLRAALTDALGAARPGDRLRRFDAATARWLRP